MPRPRSDKIVKRGTKYEVLSESGDRSFGVYPTREQAMRRLKQVERFKSQSKVDSIVRVPRTDRLGALHCDEGRVDGIYLETTPEGFLRCDGYLTRTGVFEYGNEEGDVWGEYRDEDEVFAPEALKSFEMVVITDDHPTEMISADNVRELQVGHVGSDVRREGDYVKASLLITDPVVIELIREGKVELSCGYMAEVCDEPGVSPDGTPYRYRQRNIVGNHLALVERGRAGPMCRLMFDGLGAAITTGVLDMTLRSKNKKKDAKVMVGGEEHEVPEAVAMAMAEMQAKLAKIAEAEGAEEAMLGESEEMDEDMSAGEMISAMSQDMTSEEEKMMAADKTDKADSKKAVKADAMLALQAKVDALEAALKDSRKDEAARIDARVNLVSVARDVLGADVKTDGVSDLGIQRAVVASIRPSLKGKLDKKPAAYVQALYDVCVEEFRNRVDSSHELLSATVQVHEDAQKFDLDNVYDAYVKNLGRHARGAVESN